MGEKAAVPILLCTGPTGGHFFPALSLAETFRAERPEVEVHILINRTPGFAEPILRNSLFQFHVIPVSPFPSFFSLKIFRFLLEYVRAFWKTLVLFRRLRPRLVVGFGSYGSVLGVLCGAFLRIPILIHEQNARAGRANQFLSLWADQIAVSFPETEGWFSRKQILWTGYPIRPQMKQDVDCLDHNGKGKNAFTILVFGGSQGAERINHVFLKAIERIEAEERDQLAVIHIIGNADVEEIRSAYQRLGISAEVNSFCHRIFDFYRVSDLVIARAGAGTIFELAAFGRAAILIPYPYAYAHQKYNAEYLARRNAACVMGEAHLNADTLWAQIHELKRNEKRRFELGENIRRLAKREAGTVLAQAGWELTCVQA